MDCSFGRAVPAREYEVEVSFHRFHFFSSFLIHHDRWGVQLRSTMWPGAPVMILCIQPPTQGLLSPYNAEFLNLQVQVLNISTQAKILYPGWHTPSSCLTMGENMAFFCLPQNCHRWKLLQKVFAKDFCVIQSLHRWQLTPGLL